MKGKDTSYREYVKQYGSPAPDPLPENEYIIDIVYNYYNLFVDGMGGISAPGIIGVLDVEGIHGNVKKIFLQKITYYIVSSLEVRQKETTFKDK